MPLLLSVCLIKNYRYLGEYLEEQILHIFGFGYLHYVVSWLQLTARRPTEQAIGISIRQRLHTGRRTNSGAAAHRG